MAVEEYKSLKLHFQDFEADEIREIMLEEDLLDMRRSTLPNYWFITITPEVFERLKVSLLISSCVLTQEEDSNYIEITRIKL